MQLPRQSSAGLNLRFAVWSAAVFSGMANLLGLTGPIFMLEIYDRVIPSRSIPTLSALLVLAAGLYAFSGFFDVLRYRVMARIASGVDASLSARVFAVIARAPLKGQVEGDALRPARDLDQVRGFLTSQGPSALFDLPWTPLYVAVCFLLHPLVGWFVVAGTVVLAGLTVITDIRTRRLLKEASAAQALRNKFGEAANRDAEAFAAMGMASRASVLWEQSHREYTRLQRVAGDIGGTLSGVSKAFRYLLQSATLGLGAYLVIYDEMSAGMIVAGSIIVAKALAPAEHVIGNWRGMLGAREAWKRLNDLMAHFPMEDERTAIPPPSRSLAVEGAYIAPPSDPRRLTVQNATFTLKAGSVLGILGPSGSGKSSLIRGLVGVWPLIRGSVRLDSATLDQWAPEERGRFVGYMPQAVELFPGTVAENVARLDPFADDDRIVAAALAAGVHDMIVQFPDGYETRVGERGLGLSAGQRQRIALARALYGNPFLVVLDEPNSNLDTEGERALTQAIKGVRARGGIVIVVAHRAGILASLDFVLAMEAGMVRSFGPRDAVVKQGQRGTVVPPLKVIEGEAVAHEAG
jgi:ATP-binding cassette subfamily C protein PrsD